VLEHVQEHDRVRAAVRLVQSLEGLLLEVDVEPCSAHLDGPLRRLDAARAPAGCAGGIEEKADVRPDLEETVSGHEVAAHDVQDPVEEPAPAFFLTEVVLVRDRRVAFEDLRRIEPRLGADHPAAAALENVVVLRKSAARATVLASGRFVGDIRGVEEQLLLGAAREASTRDLRSCCSRSCVTTPPGERRPVASAAARRRLSRAVRERVCDVLQ
jgi:hypothetical protein